MKFLLRRVGISSTVKTSKALLFCLTSYLTNGTAIALVLLTPFKGVAQITPDNTLNNPTVVNSNNNTVVITGGTRTGQNLFHSFQEFSIPTGNTASFRQINPDIINVISRVTGGNISNIDGTIEVLQSNGNLSSANLFIINPNGIVFGENASLNVGGSFFATTADSIKFNDDSEFSAVNPQNSALLIVTTPIGLQFGKTPGEIRSQSTLQLTPGKTFALLGSSLTFQNRATVAVPGGNIELGSVGENSLINLVSTNDNNFELNYDEVENFQNIEFNQSRLDSSGIGGGRIQVQGENITLTNLSGIGAANSGGVDGKEIKVRASDLKIEGNSRIVSLASNSGKAADINLNVNKLTISDASQVNSIALSEGQTGNLTVNASQSIEANGGLVSRNGRWSASGLFTQVAGNANGNGGKLTLNTQKLTISNGAQIANNTFGNGNAGVMEVNASNVEISGVAMTPNGELVKGQFDLTFNSGLYTTVEFNATGNGGELNLNADRVILSNGGLVQTSTLSSGDAGNLKVKASEFIEVNGIDTENIFPTSILASSGGINGVRLGVPSATGKGGNLEIETPSLRVINGSAIAVGSINPNAEKGAGTLTIKANNIRLDGGRLVSDTASGSGGDINLQLQDLLVLRNNSQISSSAGSSNQPGDGGNINVQSPNGFIVAAPNENSDITANAFSGLGGDVKINAAGIFGIQPLTRDELVTLLGTDDPNQLNPASLQSSDITAVSRQEPNSSGNIEIDTLDNEIQETPQLPTDIKQSQFDQRCHADRVMRNSFTIAGRGGLPPSPRQYLSSSSLWEDWRIVENNNRGNSSSRKFPYKIGEVLKPRKIVEATRLIVDADGNTALIASTSNRINGDFWNNSSVCSL